MHFFPVPPSYKKIFKHSLNGLFYYSLRGGTRGTRSGHLVGHKYDYTFFLY